MRIKQLTKADILDICTWIYEGEYVCYSEDSYESKMKRQADILNPQKKEDFFGVVDQDVLVAYVHLNRKADAVMMGIAVRPDLCGQGYGVQVIRLAQSVIEEKYPDLPLRLMVRSWNQRAVRCYQKAGFETIGYQSMTTPAGPGEFMIMEMI